MFMGCKVIVAGRGVATQTVFATPKTDVEPTPLFLRSATESATPDPELHRLRGRIVELEAALQTQVAEAKQAGWRAGEAAGREHARAELAPALDRLTHAIAELAPLRDRIRRESESDLVKLSLCIAKRILRRELTVDADAVHGLVKAALDKVQAKDLRRVRVHPDFQGTIRRHVETSGVVLGAEIVADASLQPGDVIVETRLGDLDASIDSQLAEIERGFADRLKR
jgi:flagellar assembly protein FliH